MKTEQVQLTVQQRKACSIDRDIAVNAGAGSGKTRVLVERYLRLLDEHPELTARQIVAITFTRKAAAEMKMRITDRLDVRINSGSGSEAEVRRWMEFKDNLPNAPIGTIHAFAADILREFSLAARIDPRFRIADESEAVQFKRMAAEQALIWAEDEKDLTDDLKQVLLEFPRSDVIGILGELAAHGIGREAILKIADSQAYFQHIYDRLVEFFPETRVIELLRDAVSAQGSMLKKETTVYQKLNDVLKLFESKHIPDRLTAVSRLLEILFKSTGTPYSTKSFKQIGSIVNDLARLTEPISTLRGFFDPDLEIRAQSMMTRLAPLAEMASEQLQMIRLETGALSFNDLEQLTVQLLEKSPERGFVLKRLRDRYRFIMIDEFQDTNQIQWRMIEPLLYTEEGSPSPGKLFVVGDPKQSIYGFRGADVTVFSRVSRWIARRNEQLLLAGKALSQTNENLNPGETTSERRGYIRMPDNFRSRARILQFADFLCGSVMDGQGEFETVYEPVVCARKYDGFHGEVGILAPQYQSGNEKNASMSESQPVNPYNLLASHIKQLVKSGNAGYGDIAVMFPKRTRLTELKSALVESGVPYAVYQGRGFWEQREVVDIVNLIRWLADPNDRKSLYAFLHSPLSGCTDEILLYLYQYEPGFPDGDEPGRSDIKSDFKETVHIVSTLRRELKRIKYRADRIPVSILLESFLTKMGAWGAYIFDSGPQSVANIEKLLDIISRMEGDGVPSLQYVAEILGERCDQGDVESEDLLPSEENHVLLMTIHAAKGLEFPVVYLVDIETLGVDHGRSMIFDPDLGPGFRFPARFGKETGKSAVYNIYSLIQRQKQAAEYKRLLYVGITRAMDRLYFLHNPGIRRPRSKETWWDWIETALGLTEEDWRKGEKEVNVTNDILLPIKLVTSVRTTTETRRHAFDFQNMSELIKVMDKPLPLSVETIQTQSFCPIRVTPTQLAAYITDKEAFIHEQILRLPRNFRSASSQNNVMLGQAVGTAFHACMESPGTRQWCQENIQSLAVQHGIPPHQMNEFKRRLEHAFDMVKKWFRFKEIVESEGFSELPFTLEIGRGLVEGVIDRAYQYKGRWKIIDYKTDEMDTLMNPESWLTERSEHHRLQMDLYALALSQWIALNQPKIEVILFFTSPGKEVVLEYTKADLKAIRSKIGVLIDGIVELMESFQIPF